MGLRLQPAMIQRLLDKLAIKPSFVNPPAEHITCRLHDQPHLTDYDDKRALLINIAQAGIASATEACGSCGCVAEVNASLGRGSFHRQRRDNLGTVVFDFLAKGCCLASCAMHQLMCLQQWQ